MTQKPQTLKSPNSITVGIGENQLQVFCPPNSHTRLSQMQPTKTLKRVTSASWAHYFKSLAYTA